MAKAGSAVPEEEKVWGLIAWLLSVVGAVITLALKPTYRYAKYWAYLSISFFIVAILSTIVVSILSLIPIVGRILNALISLALLVVYVIGIVKSISLDYWKPPVIYDLAKIIGIEKM
ncbi:MAG: hypothetical protein RMH84_01795 [Sulfolobales archaeon]|nr:hypothetical protein [Sulfolobales archaeon]MCX8208658.1 hypothetical protein [Sulfolobales archaeon]MDW8010316.1 hypothetical protein [Sulfolobales archaeon]